MKTPILGSSYVARSVNAADNRMVNLYPEVVPEGGKEPAFLSRCPGLFASTPAGIGGAGSGAIRGMYVVNTNMYVVSGQNFYQVDLNGNATFRGTVNDNLPVSMADNGTQLFIAASQTGKGYIYNMVTHAFAQIVDVDYPASGAGTVGYLDGFFVFNERNSQKVWVTDLLNGSSIQPLNFASAEAASDNVVAVTVNGDELWVFGSTTTEVWYNAGTAGFPFAPIQGAFTESGCAAAYSVAKMDSTIFWVGNNAQGNGIVYKANGYRGERISTHAVEKWIQDYVNVGGAGGYTLAEAVAYTYQQEGHLFYVLVLQGSATSWVYDVTTGLWHERAGWDGTNFTQYPGNCHAFHRGLHWLGSYSGATLYYLVQDYSTAITFVASKWLRSWRALATGQNNLKRTAHHSLQLDCETGVGNTISSNPTVTLRWSDDGGHTWSTGSSLTMGVAADYSKRLIWRRLGMTMRLRDRVYEVSGTDQANIFIMGAELIMSPTNA